MYSITAIIDSRIHINGISYYSNYRFWIISIGYTITAMISIGSGIHINGLYYYSNCKSNCIYYYSTYRLWNTYQWYI